MLKRTSGVLAGLLALSLLLAVPANAASPNIEKVKRGQCTGGATWKLEVDKEAGQIEADFEVYTNSPAGVLWHVRMLDNSRLFLSRDARSNARGDIDVEGHTYDRAGTLDTIRARAVRHATGQVCQGVISI